jgi:hypothetical protein
MSDETEDTPDLNIEWEPSDRSEFVQCNTCQIVAPRGFEELAETLGALLFRIQDKTGDVEVLEAIDKPWRVAGKADSAGTLKAVEK